jgi:Patched family
VIQQYLYNTTTVPKRNITAATAATKIWSSGWCQKLEGEKEVRPTLHKLLSCQLEPNRISLVVAMSGTQGISVEDPRVSTSVDNVVEGSNAWTEVSMLDAASLLNSSQASIIDFVAKSHSTVLNWWWTSADPDIECVTTTCGRFVQEEETVAGSNTAHGMPTLVTTSLVLDDQSSLDSKSQASTSSNERQPNPQQAALTGNTPSNQPRGRPLRSQDQNHLVEGESSDQQCDMQRQASRVSDTHRPQPKTLLDGMNETTAVPVGRQFSFEGEPCLKGKFTKATSGVTETSNGSSTGSSSVGSLDSPDEPKSPFKDNSWKEKWAQFVRKIGDAITWFITACALLAARNPYFCIGTTTLIAFTMIVAGYLTNFQLVVDNTELWPPRNSFSYQQSNWYYDESEFNYDPRNIDLVIHANGGNVLTRNGVEHVFKAMNVIQSMENYQQGCQWADLVGDEYRVGQCHEHSVADFWNRNIYQLVRNAQSDEEIREAMSAAAYPNGESVDLPRIIGNAERDENGTLIRAESFLVEFDLPWSEETIEFELETLNALLELKEQWKSDENNPFELEFMAYRSYEDEFLRAILLDLPLLPAVFVVVCLFCCLVFWRNDKVQSRCLLGVGAVVCTLLGIMASHGLMFLCGIPFTTSTTMLPFLMFGKSFSSQWQRFGAEILT